MHKEHFIDFITKLFDTSGLAPIWQFGGWSGLHGWLYLVGNLLLWSSFFAIFLYIIRYLVLQRKGRSLNYRRFYFFFNILVAVCTATFLLNAMLLWWPVYRFDTLLRVVAGLSSWAMLFYLRRISPSSFTLKTQVQMRQELDERKKIQEQLHHKNERLEEAEKIAKLGYVAWDVTKENIEASEMAYEILGFNRNDKTDYESIRQLIHPEDAGVLDEMLEKFFIGKRFPEFNFRVVLPDGKVKHIVVRGEIVTDANGNITNILGTLQDVTRISAYLQKIQQQNKQLKDIAWIQSHKVRSPVASILGLAQLLNTDDPTDPTNAEVIEGIVEASNNLDVVIREIDAQTKTVEV